MSKSRCGIREAMIGEASTIRPAVPTPLSAAGDTNLTFTTAANAVTGPNAKKVPGTCSFPEPDTFKFPGKVLSQGLSEGEKGLAVWETAMDPSADASCPISSYDYIRDWRGDIYVVRGIICGTPEIIVRPISICGATGPEKYNRNVTVHTQRIRYPVYAWGDPDNYVFSIDDIQTIFARDKVPCCERLEGHELISDITEALSSHNATTYLFGSRRIDLARAASDFDILVVGNGCGRQMIERVATNLGAGVRLFNNTECLERARRYGGPHSYISKHFLIKAFQKTTCYMKTDIGEIGVFFASNNDTVIPKLPLKGKSPHRLRGRIVRSDGSSHLMPRTFKVECRDGSLMAIGTILWSLGGIEECAGEEISLGGLYMVSKARYWLGGAGTSIEFI